MKSEKSQLLGHFAKRDLLRFMACGSVDDGKSTLMGRLLYDGDKIFDDQLKTLKKDSAKRGLKTDDGEVLDFSLLLDGLEAEREQGITIDVAYKYFSTTKRSFVIIDTPGHEQYTKNMATGASNADLAVLLIDAKRGVTKQTKRHLIVCQLMGIKKIIIVVNKIDLVGFSKEVFDSHKESFSEYLNKVDKDKSIGAFFVPISALHGDNVTKKSKRITWYKGKTLMEILESVKVEKKKGEKSRFLVKFVLRPNSDFRGYCGVMAAGELKVGDKIVVLPSNKTTNIKAIYSYTKKVKKAEIGDSVCIETTDEIDISRGDVIVKIGEQVGLTTEVSATIFWMGDIASSQGKNYLVKFNNKFLNSRLKIEEKYDIDDFSKIKAKQVVANDVGLGVLTFAEPVVVDEYDQCKETGSFILVDKITQQTVGVGIVNSVKEDEEIKRKLNIFWHAHNVKKQQRSIIKNQNPKVLWLTGLPASGKSTIANLLEKKLLEHSYHTYVLDGDNVRYGLNKDLGFSKEDRSENIRRVAEVGKLMADAGLIVIAAFISPLNSDRQVAKEIIGQDGFIQIYIDTPLEECIKRDPKKLYKKALSGGIKDFTGISAGYELPSDADLVVSTVNKSAEECADQIFDFITEKVAI